jgi:hypothetical protein
MTAHIVRNDSVETVSDATFFRLAFGHYPRVRTAEEEARLANARLIETIHKAAYLEAHREREAIVRDRMENGTGDYATYLRKVNEPFYRAAEIVNQAVAELQRKRAA